MSQPQPPGGPLNPYGQPPTGPPGYPPVGYPPYPWNFNPYPTTYAYPDPYGPPAGPPVGVTARIFDASVNPEPPFGQVQLAPSSPQDSPIFLLPKDVMKIFISFGIGSNILETCRIAYQKWVPLYHWIDTKAIEYVLIPPFSLIFFRDDILGFYTDYTNEFSQAYANPGSAHYTLGFQLEKSGEWTGIQKPYYGYNMTSQIDRKG